MSSEKRVSMVILGDPVGKQRPRVSMANGVVRTYTPNKTANYETLIAHEYMSKYGKRMFEQGEHIRATVIAYFGLNKGDYGKKGLNKSGREKIFGVFANTHCDIDNIVKVVLDSLNSICYNDDRQVVELCAKKLYTQDTPRVEITLESLNYVER